MNILISLLLNAIAVMVTAYLLPGVRVQSFFTAIVVAVVLGVVNAILKPILFILTLPVNILTLGLFTFILNGFIILVVSAVVPGFRVNGFLWAILFSIILSLINGFLSALK